MESVLISVKSDGVHFADGCEVDIPAGGAPMLHSAGIFSRSIHQSLFVDMGSRNSWCV